MNINRIPRRTAGIVAAIAATVLPLAAFASPAAATDEFPPNPAATIAASCGASGGIISVHYTNVGGLDNANFTTTIDGVAQPAVSLVPNTTSDLAVAAAEGAPGVVVVSDSPYTTTMTVGPIDCFDGSGAITLDCTTGTPQLAAVANNVGKSPNVATFTLDGDSTSPEPAAIAAAGTHTFNRTLAEDAAYHATITWAHDGTKAEVSGTADCLPPATTTTIPATTTTVPEAVQLPVTGSTSGGVVVTASLLTLLGIIVVRVVRRPKTVR